MSNVFSNASFAVLSVMDTFNQKKDHVSSTVFVQRKPEENYPNILVLDYTPGPEANDFKLKDFNIQERFEANVCSNIMVGLNEMDTMVEAGGITISNSNISVNSYKMSASVISG